MKEGCYCLSTGEVIRCRSVGEGKTIVLFHGFGIDSTVWDGVLPYLIKKFRVVLVDLPGYGQNTHLWRADLSVFAEFFKAVFVREKGASIVAYSFGGNMLLRYLQQERATIPKGIIFLSAPIKEGMLSKLTSLFLGFCSLSNLVSSVIISLLTRPPLRSIIIRVGGLVALTDEKIIDYCVHRIIHFENPSFLCKTLACVFLPLRRGVVIQCEVVGLFGEHDGFVSQKNDGTLLSRFFSSYNERVIPGVFHLSPLENPKALAGNMIEILETH